MGTITSTCSVFCRLLASVRVANLKHGPLKEYHYFLQLAAYHISKVHVGAIITKIIDQY
jgi:hypothetical protein